MPLFLEDRAPLTFLVPTRTSSTSDRIALPIREEDDALEDLSVMEWDGPEGLKVSAEGPTRLQHDQPDCHRTASIVYVDSPATLINIRNRTATSASTITLAVQIRTSHPMRRGQEAVRTEGCSTIS
jgi:hypothetical protein